MIRRLADPAAEPRALRRAGFEAHGRGPVVMLLHSSASGRRQWRTLAPALATRFRVVALDLIGYGETAPWSERRPQKLSDQAALVHDAIERVGEPLALVGHSFGAAVALCAAAELGDRLRGLVLIEPTAFSLLAEAGAADYAEAVWLREAVTTAAERGDWRVAAARFADYWNGAGAWAAMPEERRASFVRKLEPNLHEWEAVMGAPAGRYASTVHATTHVIAARNTVAPVARIVTLLERLRPDWHVSWVERGGHMAPVTEPGLVDPLVTAALERLHADAPVPEQGSWAAARRRARAHARPGDGAVVHRHRAPHRP